MGAGDRRRFPFALCGVVDVDGVDDRIEIHLFDFQHLVAVKTDMEDKKEIGEFINLIRGGTR